MTNIELVNDILLMIGVTGEGITASPEQGALVLRIADELADAWSDDELIVNWVSDAALDDVCSLSGIELAAFKPHVAVRLCPYFGRQPDPTLIALANSAYEKLLRIQLVRSIEPVTLQLPAGEGDSGFIDIASPDFR